jgi:ABC-2 type transport system permease protein
METNSKRNFYNWTFLSLFIIGLVIINIIAALTYFRIDFTEDNRYSLANNTKSYLENEENFNNRLLFKIYLEGKLPAEIKSFRNAIEDKLKEFKQYAGNRIEYQFIDPTQGSEEDQAFLFQSLYNKGKGIVPMDVLYAKDGSNSQMTLWPGAEVEYNGSTVSYVQFLPGTPQGKFYELNDQFGSQIQNSINNLEYILISAIKRATQNRKPRIAFLQGHGELNFAQTQRVRAIISPYYRVEDLFLNDSIDALKDVDGLVIARPTKPFSDKDKYLIDQFLMNGGRLMCFLDKLQVPEDSLIKNGYTHTMRHELNIDKMLFDYGIKVNDNFVFDVQCAPKLVPTAKEYLIPWFYSVRSTNTIHPIARNLDPVLFNYVSHVEFVGDDKNVKKEILTSSTNSSVTGLAPMVSLIMYKNYGPNPRLNPTPDDNSNKKMIAGVVEGKFNSHFKNRIVSEFANNKAINFLETSKSEGKVLVVGNGRFIQNKYDSTLRSSDSMYLYRPAALNNLKVDETMAMLNMQPLIYGNQEFFQNLVDYMMGDHSVLDIRSKQIDVHAIDKEKVKVEAGFYKLLNTIFPSFLILILGVIFYYIRKRKYTV